MENPWDIPKQQMDDLEQPPIFGKSDCTRSPEEEDDRVKLGDSICLACPALLHRLTGHVRCSSPAQFTEKLWEKPGVNSDLALTSHFSAQGKKVQKLSRC